MIKLLTIKTLFVITLLIGFSWFVSALAKEFNNPSNVITPKYEVIKLDAEKVFELVNQRRISEGFQPYIKDDRLCSIATDRVTTSKFDDGHQPFYDKYSNYPYVLQENLSIDVSEQETVDGWYRSKPHAETLRKPYTYSCVACNVGYCAQIFSNF